MSSAHWAKAKWAPWLIVSPLRCLRGFIAKKFLSYLCVYTRRTRGRPFTMLDRINLNGKAILSVSEGFQVLIQRFDGFKCFAVGLKARNVIMVESTGIKLFAAKKKYLVGCWVLWGVDKFNRLKLSLRCKQRWIWRAFMCLHTRWCVAVPPTTIGDEGTVSTWAWWECLRLCDRPAIERLSLDLKLTRVNMKKCREDQHIVMWSCCRRFWRNRHRWYLKPCSTRNTLRSKRRNHCSERKKLGLRRGYQSMKGRKWRSQICRYDKIWGSQRRCKRYVLIPSVWINLVRYSFDCALDSSVSRESIFLFSGLQITSYFSPSLFGLIVFLLWAASDLFKFSNLLVLSHRFLVSGLEQPLQQLMFSASFAARLKRLLWLSKFQASSVACTLPLMAIRQNCLWKSLLISLVS